MKVAITLSNKTVAPKITHTIEVDNSGLLNEDTGEVDECALAEYCFDYLCEHMLSWDYEILTE